MASAPVRNLPIVGVYRRQSQVFVDIPPSPLLNRARFQPQKVDNPSNQHKESKENFVLLSTKASGINNIPTKPKINPKRKLQDDQEIETNTKPKKLKAHKADEENLVICHQCRSKKSPDLLLRCTSNLKKTGKRCTTSYCNACLKTRYGENLEAISQRKPPQSREGHDLTTNYHFTCPRCSNSCNCAPCRKRKGLAPVGKIVSPQDGLSVRELLEANPQVSGTLPKKTVKPGTAIKLWKFSHVEVLSTNVTDSRIETGDSVKQTRTRISKPVDTDRKKQTKPVSEPMWRPVNQIFTKQEIEDRIYLREFVLRFNTILKIARGNIEDLDDFSTLHDQSTKAVLISLLDIIAVENDNQKKKIQAAIKSIRGLGLNWNKIIPVIYDLRDSAPQDHPLRSLPDIEQSGVEVEVTHNTRGAKMQGVHARQLLSVLLHFVDIVSVGESVREELEEGNRQGKEVRALYFKAQREEAERWTIRRAELTEEKEDLKKKGSAMDAFRVKYREAEGQHKAIAFDIQNSFKPELDICYSRFTSLGCDMDGRTYYGLSASGPQRGKKERLPAEGEISKKWGWFIFVWGKPGTVVEVSEVGAEAKEPGVPLGERWWFFADVQEMRRLSKWLAYRAEVDMPDKHTNATKLSTAVDTQRPNISPTSRTPNLPPVSPRHTAEAAVDSRSSPPCPYSGMPNASLEHNGMVIDEHIGDMTNLSLSATSASVKALAKAVLEFADFVDWRHDRSAKGMRKDLQ